MVALVAAAPVVIRAMVAPPALLLTTGSHLDQGNPDQVAAVAAGASMAVADKLRGAVWVYMVKVLVVPVGVSQVAPEIVVSQVVFYAVVQRMVADKPVAVAHPADALERCESYGPEQAGSSLALVLTNLNII